jgi:hypothetical protein
MQIEKEKTLMEKRKFNFKRKNLFWRLETEKRNEIDLITIQDSC